MEDCLFVCRYVFCACWALPSDGPQRDAARSKHRITGKPIFVSCKLINRLHFLSYGVNPLECGLYPQLKEKEQLGPATAPLLLAEQPRIAQPSYLHSTEKWETACSKLQADSVATRVLKEQLEYAAIRKK